MKNIQEQVDQLIEENKALKRQLARYQSAESGGPSRRVLAGLQRRLQTALSRDEDGSFGLRRKVTDPETLRKRNEALAKARAVRKERREAAKSNL
ncbi:MAG: hypothetical protein ACREN8_02050 [Candidatus Dormibacteraceae bacterium]